jgi:hypothetical protein
MSTKLEEKIRAIMEGTDLSEDKKMTADASSKKAAKEEEDVKNAASAQAKKTGKEEEDLAGKKDKAEVKEATIPGQSHDFKGDSTSGVSGDADDARGHLKSGAPGAPSDSIENPGKSKLKQQEKKDAKDPAAESDDERGHLKSGAPGTPSEKGGKLHSPMKEHMSVLFDGETLSEEFKIKAEAIFEAAVAEVIDAKATELQEEMQQQVNEAVEVVKGELVEQIDEYLGEVVEQWMEDNAVALESGIKVEMVNSFIDGIKNVFQEHYVEVPEEKLDVVAEQASQIEELQDQLAAIQEEKEHAIKEATILRCEDILSVQVKGLTAIEEEKFRGLAENVEFETEDEFAQKVKALRESYFKKSAEVTSQEVTTSLTETKETSETVNAVLEALKKGNKMKFVRN